MAIVQISQITNRKGLQIDLPQLAGAEFGWSVDERRLWIGNGTLAEGAPVVGNTEILTEFSDIININTAYTYKGNPDTGYEVQTGPYPGVPITQSLQGWLDQFATVQDFGAVGDGVTDDTEAINRALQQLYCVPPYNDNTQVRRGLFFPAGVYRISNTIKIPTYATLYGEGINNSIIRMDSNEDSTLTEYVARTADSLQQIGADIGTNGATPPTSITISDLGFQNLDLSTSIFLVEDATNCTFTNVGFYGPLTTAGLTTDALGTKCVEFLNDPSYPISNVAFTGCQFTGTVWALNTNAAASGINIDRSSFNTLYQGVLIGTTAAVATQPSGFRITNNIFDNIYDEGIVFGTYTTLNASGYNIFYDVGNNFAGISSPAASIILMQNGNNVSLGDMFARTNVNSSVYPRINVGTTQSIAITNGSKLQLGTYNIQSGGSATLVNNSLVPVVIVTVTDLSSFVFNYAITRGTAYRTGTFFITANSIAGNDLNWSEDFVENTPTGITLFPLQFGNNIQICYTSTNISLNGTITYSRTNFST